MTTSYLSPPFKARNPAAKVLEQQLSQRRSLVIDPLIGTAEACTILNISGSTFDQMVKAGVIPVVRFTPTSHRRVKTSVLKRLLESGATNGA